MRYLIIIFALIFHVFSFAQTTDDTVELRAREVGRSLRCVVCQNQSIEDSDATLAEDMRRLVRSRIKSGDSNQEVLDFMQQRYGDFVLLKPPVQKNTVVLWWGPFVAIGLGLLWFFISLGRRKKTAKPQTLTADERAKLDSILRGENL